MHNQIILHSKTTPPRQLKAWEEWKHRYWRLYWKKGVACSEVGITTQCHMN